MVYSENFEIFRCQSYREALKGLIEWRKKNGKVFSYRWFAQQAGYTSPNFLKLVIDGKRDLSEESTEKVIAVFKLKNPEARFFRLLVKRDKAKSTEEKNEISIKILKLQNGESNLVLHEAQLKYYSEWYHIPIRELIASQMHSRDGVVLTAEVLARTLVPNVTIKQAQEALENLLSLGLIAKDEKKGWRAVQDNVVALDGAPRSFIVGYHQAMMGLAQESLDRFKSSERDISSVTLNLSARSLAEVKKLVTEFREKLIEFADSEKAADQVIQLNIQLFPLTRKKNEGNPK